MFAIDDFNDQRIMSVYNRYILKHFFLNYQIRNLSKFVHKTLQVSV